MNKSVKSRRNLYGFKAICKKTPAQGLMIFLLCMACFLPAELSAQGTTIRLQSRAAKDKTVKAVQSMNQGRLNVGRDLIANARDPLAAKLYNWFIFTRVGEITDYTRLVQFIRSNPDWPEINTLRKKAEEKMPVSLSAREVVTWFNHFPPRTGEGIDRYVGALQNTGQAAKARNVLSEWWASNSLSRDDQRKLFRKYKSSLSVEAHKQRFDNLLYKGQYTNARAIADVLGKGYPALAEARIALAENKGNVNALISRVPSQLKRDPGLMYERLRWRRKHDLDSGAAQILYKMPAAEEIGNLPAWWRERHIIIRRLIEKREWKNAYTLASGHKQKDGFPHAQAEWLAGWLALRFLNEPVTAYQHFDTLYRSVSTPVSRARGAYWAGRASEGFRDETISRRWYKIAASMPTVYYGQMAALELGLKEALPNTPPPALSSSDISRFEAAELVQAYNIFAAAGMKRQATAFLRAFVSVEKTPKAYLYAATLAARQGMMYDAVRISKDATKKGMFLTAQSYPVITDKLRDVSLEWALVHGIMRQESMFDVNAQSPVGALGLMQLMPPTAKEVAGKLGIPYSKSRLTSDPSYNIALGSSYLGRLVESYDGSYPLAIGAYNAGPGRVNRWLKEFGDPRRGEINFIDWVEMVPIYETRNYIQRVMESTYVYRLRLHRVQPTPESNLYLAMTKRR